MKHILDLIYLFVIVPYIWSTALLFMIRFRSERFISWIVRATSLITLTSIAILILCKMVGLDLYNVTLTFPLLPHHPLTVRFIIDDLSLLFSLLIAFLSSAVTFFSHRYLHLDPGYQRFFAWVQTLTLSALLIAFAGTPTTVFFGWEALGLASFMLIGFYRQREVSERSAIGALWVYRICDVGLLIFMTGMAFAISSYTMDSVLTLSELENPTVMLAFFGLVFAAMGKSGLPPFSQWLPRAMTGPTPSSAIFYGALSIHAGSYLLLRTYHQWSHFGEVRWSLFAIGFVSTIGLSFIATRQPTIKGRLAYAASAQVGIIWCEMALGFPKLAFIHLLAHALVRSYQLLISPSVILEELRMRGNAPTPFRRTTPISATLDAFALNEGYIHQIAKWAVHAILKRVPTVTRMWSAILVFVALAGITLAAWIPFLPSDSSNHLFSFLSTERTGISSWSLLATIACFVACLKGSSLNTRLYFLMLQSLLSVLQISHEVPVPISMFIAAISVLVWLAALRTVHLLRSRVTDPARYGFAESAPHLTGFLTACVLILTGFPLTTRGVLDEMILAAHSHHPVALGLGITQIFLTSICGVLIFREILFGPACSRSNRGEKPTRQHHLAWFGLLAAQIALLAAVFS